MMLDIKYVEPSLPQGVKDAIRDRRAGVLSATSEFVQPRGGSGNGFNIILQPASYEWGPVRDTDLWVVLVVAKDEKEQLVWSASQQVPPPQVKDLYHRLDKQPPGLEICMAGSRPSISKSVWKIAPKGFVDPMRYLERNETTLAVQQFEEYMRGSRQKPPSGWELLEGVKMDVRFTGAMEQFWQSSLQSRPDISNASVRRFIATPRGVHRNFPGGPNARSYDPTIRPWYRRAMAHPDNNAVATPYADAFSGQLVTSISHSLVNPDTREVLAVMAMDYASGMMQEWLADVLPSCVESTSDECLVVDTDGMVVTPDLCSSANQGGQSFYEMYPSYAGCLVSQGILAQKACKQYADEKIYRFHTMQLQGGASEFQGCMGLSMARVPGANVFLVAVPRSAQKGTYQSASVESVGVAGSLVFDTCLGDYLPVDASFGDDIQMCPAPEQASYDISEFSTLTGPSCFRPGITSRPLCAVPSSGAQGSGSAAWVIAVAVIVPVVGILVMAVFLFRWVRRCRNYRASAAPVSPPVAPPLVPPTVIQARVIAVHGPTVVGRSFP